MAKAKIDPIKLKSDLAYSIDGAKFSENNA